MKRVLLLSPPGSIESVDQELVSLNMAGLEPGHISLELSLLKEQLCDSVLLRSDRSTPGSVLFRVGGGPARAYATWFEDRLELTLAWSELEYWLAFFLKYYRDGMADVDHLDLEAERLDAPGRIVDVVVRVGAYAPPIDSGEARRRLGL